MYKTSGFPHKTSANLTQNLREEFDSNLRKETKTVKRSLVQSITKFGVFPLCVDLSYLFTLTVFKTGYHKLHLGLAPCRGGEACVLQ